MGGDSAEWRERKAKWATSYSNMATADTEERLGFRIRSLKTIPVDRILSNAKHILEGENADVISNTKEKVYDRIVEYLEVEGAPTEADPDFKEGSIIHLVYTIVGPIIRDFIRATGRKNIQLRSEKVIVSTDGETGDDETGGAEEFVVVDLVLVTEEKFIFVVEAKRSPIGEAMKLCLLAMKDIIDNNGGGAVYGFVTTGETWRMLRYDGSSHRIFGWK